MACDATWTLKISGRVYGSKKSALIIEAPEEGISTCRSMGPKGEPMERKYDCVIASARQNQEDNDYHGRSGCGWHVGDESSPVSVFFFSRWSQMVLKHCDFRVLSRSE